MNRDIIIFAGASSSGKDFLLHQCIKRFGWEKMVSFTTRQPRPNELGGVDYWFIDDEEFQWQFDNNKLLEHTSYQTTDGNKWSYGFGESSINEGVINCAIVNPDGIKQFAESSVKNRMLLVVVDAYLDTRYDAYNNRFGGVDNMTTEQLAEAWLRLGRDMKDFAEFDDKLVNKSGINELSSIPYIRVDNNMRAEGDTYEICRDIFDFISDYNSEVNDEA